MQTFTERYKKLNPAQKQAVDTIDGPVMVIAGPGTGKTELLSMRVAAILSKTDALPQNILCLTFTESGASAMRERLVGLMGKDAYHVAIHTFHSFGGEVIQNHPDYFYKGAHFRPADELYSQELFQTIFEALPHNDPLASQMNGTFTQLRDAQKAISDLKRAGIRPDELLNLLDHNEQFLKHAGPHIAEAFRTPLRSKAALTTLTPFIEQLVNFQAQPLDIPGITSLAQVCTQQAQRAIAEALEQGSTKPVTAWRTKWCEKDSRGEVVLKDVARSHKLRSLAKVYEAYLQLMENRELYDFDDMILRVVQALTSFPELRFTLQEQYQYILVDEFQDTNGAQLRLLLHLTDNPVNEGRPDILVVGDDDQAIYSFQGAEISNILTFHEQFPTATIITLTDNYRSAPPILQAARHVVTQGTERLETRLQVNKTLTPHVNAADATASLVALPTQEDEFYWLAKTIRERIRKGQSPHTIAVLTRTHKDSLKLLPYLQREHITVNYERRDNVLDSPPIQAIELVARIMTGITDQEFDQVEVLLPQLLAHPAWGIASYELWELSLDAYKKQKSWLEVLLERKDRLHDIGQWLIATAYAALNEPLETIIDVILGSNEPQAPDESFEQQIDTGPEEQYTSPLRNYFFPQNALETQPETYLSYLEALRTLRQKLRDHQPDHPPDLARFLEFIDLHRKAGLQVTSLRPIAHNQQAAICLMTAHKSKGLEFETVFVLNATDTTWGSKARSRSSAVTFPANLPVTPAGDTTDERLRLFFVAMTRAKRQLYMSYSTSNEAAKATLKAYFLESEHLAELQPSAPETAQEQIIAATARWEEGLVRVPQQDMKTILAPILEAYKLSATHLNNFVDVTAGGPQTVLLQNLLRFPQAMLPSAAFGSAIHHTLHRAHSHYSATGKRRPVEDVLRDFEIALTERRLTARDFEFYLQKGSDALNTFLEQSYGNFTENDIAEKSFAHQGVTIGTAKLTGAIDLIRRHPQQPYLTITDYKTGKASQTWHGKTDLEKRKLHRYKQQLLFYHLLVKHSREYKQYTVTESQLVFVEPTKSGEIVHLPFIPTTEELDIFETLIAAVWRHIQALDFPDISQYPPTYQGICLFEQDLIDEKI